MNLQFAKDFNLSHLIAAKTCNSTLILFRTMNFALDATNRPTDSDDYILSLNY